LIAAVGVHKPELGNKGRSRFGAKNQLPAVGDQATQQVLPPLDPKKVSCVTSVPSGFIVKTSPDAPVNAIRPFFPGKVACVCPANASVNKKTPRLAISLFVKAFMHTTPSCGQSPFMVALSPEQSTGTATRAEFVT